MGQAGTLMMNSMKRFVKQRESNQPSQPALRDDAPGSAIYRVARHPDVLDVLAPTLQIGRQKRRREIHPNEIFPQIECCDRPEDQTSTSQPSAPIPPKCAGERVCFEPAKENKERLAGKQTG